ncbi:hypothetical protein [Archaeoglobus neptunius]|nr:hypothetical protein [Archaeoglobus neptunius]
MKWLEGLVVVAAMTVPFMAIRSYDLTTYIYWSLVAALYLIYIAISRW